MIGDSTDTVWGVMDIYPRTNYPDIRRKATLRSKFGNLIVSECTEFCPEVNHLTFRFERTSNPILTPLDHSP